MDNSIYKKYNELVSLIFKYGEYFDKEHGDWIRLKYIDDYYFCMDSWNKRIELIYKPEYINKWGGFSGAIIYNLGLDFGGFACRVEEEQLDCWIENLKYELGRSDYDFSKLAI